MYLFVIILINVGDKEELFQKFTIKCKSNTIKQAKSAKFQLLSKQ